MAIWNWREDKSVKWSFVVDLDTYAGNWERELSGYVVGQHDEYGDHRGGPYVKLFQEECPDDPFDDLVEWRIADPGDDGIHRSPCDLAPTPGTDEEFNSVAIFLMRKPDASELKVLVKRARKFATIKPQHRFNRPMPVVLGCRLVQETLLVKSQKVRG